MPQSEVVVLAKSIKHQKYCVAGKCVQTGQWIRPVSNLQGGELSNKQTQIKNPFGTFGVKVLHKAKIGLAQHAPLIHQPDNYLIDGTVWVQNYTFNAANLNTLLDTPNDLWGPSHRLDYAQIVAGLHNISQSLYLVKVDDLNLYYGVGGNRRVSFTYGGINYDLPSTDPQFGNIVSKNLPTSGILCVSLGEQFQGYCYKIVATIF